MSITHIPGTPTKAKRCCAVKRAVHAPVAPSKTQLLITSIMTRMYLCPPSLSRPSSPNGSLAPTYLVEIVEADDFARPVAVHGLIKRARHLLPRFKIHAMETLTNSVTCSSMRNQQQFSDSSWRVAAAPRWPASYM